MLKQLAEDRHWLPAQVLEGMTAGQFFVCFMPSRTRRRSSPERLREVRNRQRLKAGKPPL